MTNSQYTQTRNSITLILFATVALILAMALNSCASTRYSCPGVAGKMAGYHP